MERAPKFESVPGNHEDGLSSLETAYHETFDNQPERNGEKRRIDQWLIELSNRHAKNLMKIAAGASLMQGAVIIGRTEYAHHTTRYSIESTKSPDGYTEYRHEDPETTAILNYISGRAPMPEEFRLAATRSELASSLRALNLPIPDDIGTYTYEQIEAGYVRVHRELFIMRGEDVTSAEASARVREMAEAAARELPRPIVHSKFYQLLWQLQQEVGAPRIRWSLGEGEQEMFEAGRAYYVAETNTMYIHMGTPVSNVVAESAHAIQFNSDRYGGLLRGWRDNTRRTITMMREDESYRTAYDREYDVPGTIEHDAHSVIEPRLRKQIGLPPREG